MRKNQEDNGIGLILTEVCHCCLPSLIEAVYSEFPEEEHVPFVNEVHTGTRRLEKM